VKKATMLKLIIKHIGYITKIITLVREGVRVWQFPKSRLHHWPELP
jgi:hypothetical protein